MGLDIDNVSFTGIQNPQDYGTAIEFEDVNSSSVRNCSFTNVQIAIEEVLSQGGNRYTNDSFLNVEECLVIGGNHRNASIPILEHCDFSAPPTN
jgi:hypothetical protein